MRGADIEKAYREVLGRAPGSKGLEVYSSKGLSYAELCELLRQSPEYRRRAANELKPAHRRWPLNQVFVAKNVRVVYIPIAKNACTSLKRLVVSLSDVPDREAILRQHDIHRVTDRSRTGIQLRELSYEDAQEALQGPDYFRFAVVRDPLSRLLSAYWEKFVVNRLTEGNLGHTRPVLAEVAEMQGEGEPDPSRGIRFRDFVEYLEATSVERLDPHWAPQWRYLRDVGATRLYDLSDLGALWRDLSGVCGYDVMAEARNVTNSGKGVSVDGAFEMYPSELERHGSVSQDSFYSKEIQARVETLYEKDYALMKGAVRHVTGKKTAKSTQQYQSFPESKGSSKSVDKLKALRLPSLQGKRFLDVGCNEGFFCGYARFDGASEVIGIDRSRALIERARNRFPDCRFLAQSWEVLPDGRFDVILLASGLHYAENPTDLIQRLMGALEEDGLLIMELGIAPRASTEWVSFKRSNDERSFPTRKTLGIILQDYAWKMVGYSVRQEGDPVQRHVVHVQRKRPYVYLLVGSPGSGKSTLARNLFTKAEIPLVTGDAVYMQIFKGRLVAPETLTRIVRERCSSTTLNEVAERVLERGALEELVDLWCRLGGRNDFALDSYVPEAYHRAIRDAFIERGYVPVVMDWDMEKTTSSSGEAAGKADAYVRELKRSGNTLPPHRVEVRRTNDPRCDAYLRGWHIDNPADGQPVAKEVALIVSGWALPVDLEESVEVYLQAGSRRMTSPLDRRRQDVVDKRLAGIENLPEGADFCGFHFTLSEGLLDGTAAEVGFLVGGRPVPVASIAVSPAPGATPPESLVSRLVSRVTSKTWLNR